MFGDDSSELVIFVHGLRGTPFRAVPYLEKIKNRYPTASVIAPRIPFACNCEFEIAASYVYNIIASYANKFPNNRITIISYSYGSLISRYAEERLSNSSLRIFTIGGIYQGTKFVDWLEYLHLDKLAMLHTDVQERLRWKEGLVPIPYRDNVEHIYIGSVHDERVFPVKTSLPEVEGAVHHILQGYTHFTILTKAMEIVLETI